MERDAYIYVRQSTAGQAQHNRESTQRQYKLVDRAVTLGWPKEKVKVIDEELARSGSGSVERGGFTKMTANVALGQIGLILSIEVSRVARNSADWYRLLDLCGVTNTLIGDEDGLYHPGLFNDRLLLGLKGTMAEAELHVIRARLDGGIRNKAARGELRRGLPVGMIWGEEDGEVLLHPDEAITRAIRTVFEKFAELGSARQVWLWFRSEGLSFPMQANSLAENSRATRCLHVGGARIDKAVSMAFLEAIAPAGMDAALRAEQLIETEHDNALAQWRLQLERARYQAERAERRYRSVEPENRLVARSLETEWEGRLNEQTTAQAELARREHQRPIHLTDEQRSHIHALGLDLNRVWEAPTTTDRDRKELLRSLLEEVKISVDRPKAQAHILLRWRGKMISEIDVALWPPKDSVVRTEEDTIDLIRRLSVHHPDGTIAGILGRQGRQTAYGLPFTASRVSSLRQHWKIPRYQPPTDTLDGQLVSVEKAAQILGAASSTVHRWLNEGFIAGEQITPGALWRIRVTEDWKERFVEEAPPGYVPMQEATKTLGVSRQTVLQRVKRGELHAVHVCRGRRNGLRIKVVNNEPSLFDSVSSGGV